MGIGSLFGFSDWTSIFSVISSCLTKLLIFRSARSVKGGTCKSSTSSALSGVYLISFSIVWICSSTFPRYPLSSSTYLDTSTWLISECLCGSSSLGMSCCSSFSILLSSSDWVLCKITSYCCCNGESYGSWSGFYWSPNGMSSCLWLYINLLDIPCENSPSLPERALIWLLCAKLLFPFFWLTSML